MTREELQKIIDRFNIDKKVNNWKEFLDNNKTMKRRELRKYMPNYPEYYNFIKPSELRYWIENSEKEGFIDERFCPICGKFIEVTTAFYDHYRCGCDEHLNRARALCAERANLKKYGVDNPSKMPEIKKIIAERAVAARKRNGTLSSSRNFEDKLVQYLRDIYPEYTILTQYKDERYPFRCDCYIKELDLFIEFQGSYYHNYRPFNGSPEHISEYEEMLTKGEITKGIAKVWRYKDPEKREYVKRNGLNFLEYWEVGYLEEVDVSEYDPVKRWQGMCISSCV